jgi:hypothetical protein
MAGLIVMIYGTGSIESWAEVDQPPNTKRTNKSDQFSEFFLQSYSWAFCRLKALAS